MKTVAKAEQIIIEQAGIKLYKVLLKFNIDHIGLNCSMEHKRGKDDILDYINEYISDECGLELEKQKIYYQEGDNTIAFDKFQFASFITRIYTTALDKLSKDGKDPFVIYISESKDKFKQYVKDNKVLDEKLKKIKAENVVKKKIIKDVTIKETVAIESPLQKKEITQSVKDTTTNKGKKKFGGVRGTLNY